MNESILKMIPDSRNIFFRKRQLFPIQVKAIPKIVQGKNVIVRSPTASGKTETIFAPLYQRHVSFKRDFISVLYICPTKALANDIYYRLKDYFIGSSEYESIYRYTGDHHNIDKKNNGFLLITTPEAIDSILLSKPFLLSKIRAVVIDEIHLLHGFSRGEQLRYLLQRLKYGIIGDFHKKDNFQVIATTATIDNIDYVKRLWLGDDAEVIESNKNRDIIFKIMPLYKCKNISYEEQLTEAIINIYESNHINKVLVFINNRTMANKLSILIKDKLNNNIDVFLHFGILSTEERDFIEQDLKNNSKYICIATSTLEVGIDIGNIDLVILVTPPRSVSSYLQRIGRGNRKSDHCNVVCIAKDENEVKLYTALNKMAKSGDIEESNDYKRYSVQFQQIISLLWTYLKDDIPVSRNNIIKIFGDYFNTTLNDMIAQGVLIELGNILIINDDLVEQCRNREMHTVIAGGVQHKIYNANNNRHSLNLDNKSEGNVLIGNKIVSMVRNESNEVFIDRDIKRSSQFPKLSNKSFFKGLENKIVINMMNDIRDPYKWIWDGSMLITSGGLKYNTIISIIIEYNHNNKAKANDVEIIISNGFNLKDNISPAKINEIIKEFDFNKVNIEKLKIFAEKTRYYRYMGEKLKKKECINAIPLESFFNWIKKCSLLIV